MERDRVLAYSVQSLLHEAQQHVHCVHVHPHVLGGAMLNFWNEENVQAGEGQVPEQVDHMTEVETGIRERERESPWW